MPHFELNTRLRKEITPYIIQFINVYHYSDLSDFSDMHREQLYGHLLGCQAIDMSFVNELICFEEFLQGVCLGYIKAEEAKSDLMERLDDIFYKPLDHWIQFEYQLATESKARPMGDELHDILWASEARGRAADHNATYFEQVRTINE